MSTAVSDSASKELRICHYILTTSKTAEQTETSTTLEFVRDKQI